MAEALEPQMGRHCRIGPLILGTGGDGVAAGQREPASVFKKLGAGASPFPVSALLLVATGPLGYAPCACWRSPACRREFVENRDSTEVPVVEGPSTHPNEIVAEPAWGRWPRSSLPFSTSSTTSRYLHPVDNRPAQTQETNLRAWTRTPRCPPAG